MAEVNDNGEAPAADTGTTLMTVEHRQVTLLDGDEVLAARVEGGDIFVPIRPLCTALGLASQSQIRRIRADEVLAESLRDLRIAAAGGAQTYQCLHLEAVPLWLALIQPSKVKAELRQRLIIYKRWVRQRVWEAFNAETGIGQELGHRDKTAASVLASAESQGEVMTLRQIESLGIALTTLAREQIALAERHDQAIAEVRQGVDELRARLDKAAIVMRDTIFDVRGLKARMTTGATVTDAQAAEIATLVKIIATALTARDRSTPGARRGSAYGALYDALYRQFDVTSYKRVRVEDYAAVVAWLEEYARAAGVAGGQAQENTDGR